MHVKRRPHERAAPYTPRGSLVRHAEVARGANAFFFVFGSPVHKKGSNRLNCPIDFQNEIVPAKRNRLVFDQIKNNCNVAISIKV